MKTLILLSCCVIGALLPGLEAQDVLVPIAPVKVNQRIVHNSDEPICETERRPALALRRVSY